LQRRGREVRSNVARRPRSNSRRRIASQVHHLGQQLDTASADGSPLREINELRVNGRLAAYLYRAADGTIFVQNDVSHAGPYTTLTVLTDPDAQLPAHGETFPVRDIHGHAIPGVALFLPRFPTAARDCAT
jgi:hypothetical protein